MKKITYESPQLACELMEPVSTLCLSNMATTLEEYNVETYEW